MGEKADTELVRRQNRFLVLEALRQNGTLARIDLGRHTGLSPATVTSITAQLIAEGVLQELDHQLPPTKPVKRGRPLTQIGLTPKSAYVVAVKISIHSGVTTTTANTTENGIRKFIGRRRK